MKAIFYLWIFVEKDRNFTCSGFAIKQGPLSSHCVGTSASLREIDIRIA